MVKTVNLRLHGFGHSEKEREETRKTKVHGDRKPMAGPGQGRGCLRGGASVWAAGTGLGGC